MIITPRIFNLMRSDNGLIVSSTVYYINALKNDRVVKEKSQIEYIPMEADDQGRALMMEKIDELMIFKYSFI